MSREFLLQLRGKFLLRWILGTVDLGKKGLKEMTSHYYHNQDQLCVARQVKLKQPSYLELLIVYERLHLSI